MISVLPSSMDIAPDLGASELSRFIQSVLGELPQNWRVTVLRGTDDRGPGSILSIVIEPQPVAVEPEEGVKQIGNGMFKAPIEERIRILKAIKPEIAEAYKSEKRLKGKVSVELERAYKAVCE